MCLALQGGVGGGQFKRPGACRSGQPGSRRGATTLLAAFLMVFMALMAAVALDAGHAILARTQLQVAADSAALAGAAVLPQGGAAVRATAAAFAGRHGAGGARVHIVPHQDVALGYWEAKTRRFRPLFGADELEANAVRVECRLTMERGNPLGLFFARIAPWAAECEASTVALPSGPKGRSQLVQ